METNRKRPTTEEAESRLLRDIQAAQFDTVDPKSVRTEPKRAVGFVEGKPIQPTI